MLVVTEMTRLEEFDNFPRQGFTNTGNILKGSPLCDVAQAFAQVLERLRRAAIGPDAKGIISLHC